LVVVVVLLVAADVESVRSGVVLMSLFRRDDAMDGIADVGSVARRVAACAFVRKESVLVERCGWPALVVDCGSILADAATVRGPGAVQSPHW
jgi:hypothetical protein